MKRFDAYEESMRKLIYCHLAHIRRGHVDLKTRRSTNQKYIFKTSKGGFNDFNIENVTLVNLFRLSEALRKSKGPQELDLLIFLSSAPELSNA